MPVSQLAAEPSGAFKPPCSDAKQPSSQAFPPFCFPVKNEIRFDFRAFASTCSTSSPQKMSNLMAPFIFPHLRYTIGQDETSPSPKRSSAARRGSILGASFTCKSLGSPVTQTQRHTQTHSPSWSTQALFVLHSSRLLALAPAFSLAALHPHTHTQTHTRQLSPAFVRRAAAPRTAESWRTEKRVLPWPGSGLAQRGDAGSARWRKIQKRRFVREGVSQLSRFLQPFPSFLCLSCSPACAPSFVCLVFSL